MFSSHANCFHSLACVYGARARARPLSNTTLMVTALIGDCEFLVLYDVFNISNLVAQRLQFARIIDDGGRSVVSLLSILYLTCLGSKSFAVGLFLCLFVRLFATIRLQPEWKLHERQVLRSDNNKMSIDRSLQ